MSDDRQHIAKKTLLKEMRDICFILTRKTWTDDLEHKLYDVMVGNSESFDGKPLANPLLSHIDALTQLSDEAGGWYTGDSEDAFVDWETWEPKYEAWKKK